MRKSDLQSKIDKLKFLYNGISYRNKTNEQQLQTTIWLNIFLMLGKRRSLSVWAAITKCHKTRWLTNSRNVFLTVSEAGSPRVPAPSGLVGVPLLGSFSHPHVAENRAQRKEALPDFIRALMSFRRAVL